MRMISTAALAALTSVALVTAAFAQSTPLPPSITETAPPTLAKPREVRTARGVAPDKPFSLVYPADLVERTARADYLALNDSARDLEVELRISLSKPNITAESAVQEFEGNLQAFHKEMQKEYPGFKLITHKLLILPAGQAQFIHWSSPQNGSNRGNHFVAVQLFQNGLSYALKFLVSAAAFERRSDAIGFMLANFATSVAARPCCADPVPLR